jgi:phosphate:Na+ symporter
MQQFIYPTLQVLGSLAVFIYGMKIMSEAIQRAAGGSLRSVLRSVTKNRFRGVLTGLVTTATIQSSSATTVMTVSLVNAGLISLIESAGLMMGANIGTTSTAWLAQLQFSLDLYNLSRPMFFVGVVLVFLNKGKLKYWGEFLVGFSILLFGLFFLDDSIPNIDKDPAFLEWVRGMVQSGFLTRFVFVVIGALMTIIIQSSSAAIILTMTMCSNGWIPLELAACMVMGENIGTTITAEVAALVGNVYARRSARIHTLFNLFGVFWMLFLLPFFLEGIIYLLDNAFNYRPSEPLYETYAICAFHTGFNVLNTLAFLPFISFLVNMAEKTVPSRNEEDEMKRLKFFRYGTLTPELATLELRKELSKYGDVVYRMHQFSQQLFNSFDKKERKKYLKKIVKYEDITDKIEQEIVDYISSISQEEMSFNTSINMRSILNICNEYERIGDTYFKISEDIRYKIENRIWLNPTLRNNLNRLGEKLELVLESIIEHLKKSKFNEANTAKSRELIKMAELFSRHIKNPVALSSSGAEEVDAESNVQGAIIYENILYQYNKIIDHLKNIVDYINGEM